MRRARLFALLGAVVFVALLATVATNFDFRAFYCSAAVARDGANPYTAQPIHRCELALPGDPFAPYSRVTALPAPVPGYVIALFIPFSFLPFAVAARAWTAVLCLACIVAILCTRRMTSLDATTVTAAFLLSLCAASLGLGESVPLFVAAIAVAAMLAQNERWAGVCAAAAASMIEPHLGLPAVIALFLWAPHTRRLLIVACGGLAALSIATLGTHANVEYFTRVLPAHAFSELGSDAQLSLSVILNGIGVRPEQAAALGTASYVIACACGIWLARILARDLNSKAFLTVTPVALAMAGGTFIHVTQMAAALPLALLLWRRLPQLRMPVAAACILLAVPWRVVGGPVLIPAAIVAMSVLAWGLFEKRLIAAGVCTAAGIALILTLNFAMTAPPMHATATPTYSQLLDSRYAEATWARYNDRYLSTGAPERWARRIPTWLGLLLLCATSVAACRVRRSETETLLFARVQHAN